MTLKLKQLTRQKLNLLGVFGLKPGDYFGRGITDQTAEAERLRAELGQRWSDLEQTLDPQRVEASSALSSWAVELHQLALNAYQQLTEGDTAEGYTAALAAYVQQVQEKGSRTPHFNHSLLLYADTASAIEILSTAAASGSSATSASASGANSDSSRARQELTAAKMKVGELERTLDSLKTARDELVRRADNEKRTAIAGRDDAFEALQKEQERNQNLVDRYDTLNATYKKHKTEAKTRIDSLVQERGELTQNLDRVTGELASTSRAKNVLDTRVVNQGAIVAKLERDQQDLVKKLQEAQATSTAYYTELTSLQEEHTARMKEMRDLDRKNGRLEDDLHEARRDHVKGYARAKTLETTGKTRERHYRAFQKESAKELTNLRRELGQALRNYRAAEETITSLEGRIQIAGDELQAGDKELEAARKVISAYETRLQEELQRYQGLEAALQEKGRLLTSQEALYQELQQNYGALQETHGRDLQVSRETIDDIRTSLAQTNGKLHMAEEVLETVARDAAAYRQDAEGQIQGHQQRAARRQEELDLALQSLEQATADVGTQRLAYEALNHDHTALGNKHDRLVEDTRTQRKDHEELMGTMREKVEKIGTLEGELSEMRETMRNVQTLYRQSQDAAMAATYSLARELIEGSSSSREVDYNRVKEARMLLVKVLTEKPEAYLSQASDLAQMLIAQGEYSLAEEVGIAISKALPARSEGWESIIAAIEHSSTCDRPDRQRWLSECYEKIKTLVQ